mgnify:CR=1 FL=1
MNGLDARRTICVVGSNLLATLEAMTLAAAWKDTNRPGPFPGASVNLQPLQNRTDNTHLLLLLLLLLLHGEGVRQPRLSRLVRGQRYPASSRRSTSPSPPVAHLPAKISGTAAPSRLSLTFASSSSRVTVSHHHHPQSHAIPSLSRSLSLSQQQKSRRQSHLFHRFRRPHGFARHTRPSANTPSAIWPTTTSTTTSSMICRRFLGACSLAQPVDVHVLTHYQLR